MKKISAIDYKFREVSNIVSMLNFAVLGYYGELSNPLKEKIKYTYNTLSFVLAKANEYVKSVVKKEKEISRLKDEFTSSISHDLRTQLTVIIGNTDLLLAQIDTIDKVALKQKLERINNSGHSILSLANGLLEFFHIESNKYHCHIEDFNLENILIDVKEVFSTTCKSKGIGLFIQPSTIKLQADYNHVYRIISNILDNAIKFTDKGKIEISNYCKDINNIIIAISDTGKGIKQEDLKNIFKRFVKIGEKGYGLGLHIAKSLAALHGGNISVESEFGSGTTFYIELPLISLINENRKS
ncbi:MAG: HAMP domain-containing histidine kinase [Spirochaetota bacterium]|nr:HAMP domain-containing histidine kinase [Spirochaetota bacterium]